MMWRTWSFAAALAVLLVGVLLVALPSAFGPAHLPATLAGLAPFALLGMASAPAIISGHGGIDLSLAPLMGLANAVLVAVLLPTPLGAPVFAVPIVLGIGLAIGAFNGFAVAVLRFPAVIATLCTFFVLKGLTLVVIPAPVTAPPNWTTVLATAVGPVPGALLGILTPLAAWAVLTRSAFVDNLLAIGDSEVAAYTSGVDVVRTRIAAYALGGVLAAFAGIALTALVSTADATLSAPYVLVALAAVAVGGVRLAGGAGGLAGPLLGAVAIYTLSAILSAFRIPATWVSVAYGVALLAAVLINGTALPRRARG